MSTSSRVVPLLLAVAILAAGAPGCGAAGDCVRYSDCSEGLTCAVGKCVPLPMPPGTQDASAQGTPPRASGGTDDAGATDAVFGSDATAD